KVRVDDGLRILAGDAKGVEQPGLSRQVVAVEKADVLAAYKLDGAIARKADVADIDVHDLEPALIGPDGLDRVPRRAIGNEERLHFNAAIARVVGRVEHAFDCRPRDRPLGMDVYDACDCRHLHSPPISMATFSVNTSLAWRDLIRLDIASRRRWPMQASNS